MTLKAVVDDENSATCAFGMRVQSWGLFKRPECVAGLRDRVIPYPKERTERGDFPRILVEGDSTKNIKRGTTESQRAQSTAARHGGSKGRIRKAGS